MTKKEDKFAGMHKALKEDREDRAMPVRDTVDLSMPAKKIQNAGYGQNAVVSVIELPKNQIKPVNRRIFAIEQDPGEMRTAGGILVPTDFSMPEAKKGIERKLRRYYVVDVADDVDLQVNGRKLERGDEIVPFIPQDAQDWTFVQAFDFYINKWYFVFEQMEICAIGMSPSLKKEE